METDMEELINNSLEIADNIIPKVAELHWKLFTELINKGFTPDQAIKIVSTTNYGAK